MGHLIKSNVKYLKTAVNMAWPSVIESLSYAIAGLIDSLMVSSMGAYAVAAIGLTMQPKFVALALFIGINTAVSALVARRKGENKREAANQILLFAIIFSFIAIIIVSIVSVIFANEIMRLSGSQPDTHESAVLFFRIIMAGMTFNVMSALINAAQKGAGNTRISMKTNLTAYSINIIGNYLLINGHFGFPALGILGTSLATVFGSFIACVMSVRSLFHNDNFISFIFVLKNKVKIRFNLIKEMWKITSSAFIEQIFLRIGFMSVSIMAAEQGTAAFAAHQVGMNIMGISFAFGDGLQIAAVTLIGQSLGEGLPDKAKKYGKICQLMGAVISVVLSFTYLVFGRGLFQLFFQENEIVDIGITIMKVMVIIVVMQISQVIYMGCLRGAGDVIFTTFASTVSVAILRPIASYVFCYVCGMGLIGLWLGIASDQMLRLILTTLRFKSGKWTKYKI